MNDYGKLLAKYDRAGPRYTSYPTAPVWRDDFTDEDYAERLRVAAQKRDEPMSLYVHVPYCDALCFFCGCSTVITQRHEKEAPYVDRVLAEARLVRETMGNARPVAQHHWGGGTPTFLAPQMIEKLFSGLNELFPVADDAEVSIEVDPRVTTREQLEMLRSLGFNRISMGVQDFDEKVQTTINRVQSFAQTEAVVNTARELGFVSANLDLIYGLPHQTKKSFARTLELFHDLDPDRIACYGYAHVPWLKKHQQVIPEDALPTGSDKLALFQMALESFLGRGYSAIGMDHFAKEEDELSVAVGNGTLHRNFMGYSTHPAEDMVAFGMSSISEIDGAFSQNLKVVTDWEAAVDSNRLPVDRGLVRSDDDERRRRVILDLMCHFQVDFSDHGGADEFSRRYPLELKELQPFIDDKLIRVDDTGIEVTELGRLFVRNICMTFDAYLRHRDKEKPMFSRTV
jgi:oxygen-independent coproporphyrinogen-3 oxidase